LEVAPAMELRQTLQLKQQLKLTVQLQQAIKLLQLNRLELAELVQQELSENPLLEEAQRAQSDEVSVSSLDLPEPQAEAPKDDDDWKKVIEEVRAMGPLPSTGIRKTDDLPPFEANVTRGESLSEHLHWQLRMARLSDRERLIGNEIIGNIGPNGYLRDDGLDAVAEQVPCTLDEADAIRQHILRFDPVGVAALNLEECLAVQAEVHFPDDELVMRIITHHLPDLVGRSILTLARKLGVSDAQLEDARQIILSLDPKPGRNYGEEETRYVVPDLYIRKDDDEYVVVLNDDGLPKLRISSYYKNLIDGKITEETKDYLKKKVRSAVWFLRSIHQRQSTVKLVGESLIKFQREFLDHGVSHLRPLVLRDVAEDIEMHESTVSRVTSNKYVHTPQGLFPLKFFFNPRIESQGGEDLASEAVRDKIRILIAQESPKKPLSDQTIVELLSQQGLTIARRTVAKYRTQLGILPSSKRVRLS
jgi:RNA polymerase sigma-54 factor